MFITQRDIQILVALFSYYTLTREQIGQLCFPNDNSKGRVPRARLQKLLAAGLLNRTRMEVVNPSMGQPAPVYFPSRKGLAYLAQQFEEPKYLSGTTQSPTWQYLYHWVEVAGAHIMLDQAAAKIEGLSIDGWLGEWSVANPDEKLPEKRFTLFTLLKDSPRLICVPDAAFLLTMQGASKVFYLELDRDTTQPAARIAAQKTPGYAGLAEAKSHRRHFPQTNIDKFMVLVVAPDARKRTALAKEFSSRPCAELYRFAALNDTEAKLTAETFLTGPVWFTSKGEKRSLIASARHPTPSTTPPTGGSPPR